MLITPESCSLCLDFGYTVLPTILPNAARLDEWLHKEFNAGMVWMQNTAEVRKHPANFNGNNYDTAFVALFKYPIGLQKKHKGIASYAHGKDYHFTIRDILKEAALQVKGQVFIDSLPVAERELAVMAGLGFIGKNTMLINSKFGSGFFISGILFNLSGLSEDLKLKILNSSKQKKINFNGCSNCNRCIDACPNGAITKDYFVDSRKCAAYLTIEHKEEFNEEQKKMASCSIFGCDICQRVCPYNKKHLIESSPYFIENKFEKKYIKGTPLERTGTKRLNRNYNNFLKIITNGNA